ncbi:unnamed protein product [Leuciscus chuanchicus]
MDCEFVESNRMHDRSLHVKALDVHKLKDAAYCVPNKSQENCLWFRCLSIPAKPPRTRTKPGIFSRTAAEFEPFLSWLAGVVLLQPGGREITVLSEEVSSAPATAVPGTREDRRSPRTHMLMKFGSTGSVPSLKWRDFIPLIGWDSSQYPTAELFPAADRWSADTPAEGIETNSAMGRYHGSSPAASERQKRTKGGSDGGVELVTNRDLEDPVEGDTMAEQRGRRTRLTSTARNPIVEQLVCGTEAET